MSNHWRYSLHRSLWYTFNWMSSVYLKHFFHAQLNGECLLKHSFTFNWMGSVCISTLSTLNWMGSVYWSTLLIQITSFYTGCSTNVTDSSDSEIDGVVLHRWHTPTMKIIIITSTITHIATSMMMNVVGGVWLTVLNKTSGFSARNCWTKSILITEMAVEYCWPLEIRAGSDCPL